MKFNLFHVSFTVLDSPCKCLFNAYFTEDLREELQTKHANLFILLVCLITAIIFNKLLCAQVGSIAIVKLFPMHISPKISEAIWL